MSDSGFEFAEESRFAKVAKLDRRRFLTTTAAAGVAAFLAACSSDDSLGLTQTESSVQGQADSLAATASRTDAPALRVQADPGASNDGTTLAGSTPSSDSTSTSTDGDTTSTAAGQSTTTAQSAESTTSTTSTTATTSTEPSTTTTGSGGSGSAVPAGGSMSIAFTYEQQSGGKQVPPYAAVWIEDSSGNLLQTVALFYQQYGRGERWLPDLRRWYQVDQSRISGGGSDNLAAVSSATRSPGSFQVGWDGRSNGTMMPAGQYYVCIESARERGPYSLIREAVTLNGSAAQVSLSSDGELVNASMSVA